MKPVINLDELEFEANENGAFASRSGVIGAKIGAKNLSYSLTVLQPGKMVCPFHNHRVEEEMFFILEGEGTLRFGANRYPLRKNDTIACPPGGRDVAHQIINTGKVDMKYLALSTKAETEVCEYPDSDKVSAVSGKYGNRDLRKLFRSSTAVDYFDGEKTK